MLKCRNCGKDFPSKIEAGGKARRLSGRLFCLECSPLDGNNRRSYVVAAEPGKAFCIRCQQSKDCGEFHRRKGGRPLSYCKGCQEQVKNLKFEEKIEKAVALKGGVCADCGSSFPAPVFEFVSAEGALPLSIAKNMSWERFCRILESREMLCRNCSALRAWAGGG
jgi:hypothetical protein